MAACQASTPLVGLTDDGELASFWHVCGLPSVAERTYRCERGHRRTRAICATHDQQPDAVGCRDCYDQGRETPMAIMPGG